MLPSSCSFSPAAFRRRTAASFRGCSLASRPSVGCSEISEAVLTSEFPHNFLYEFITLLAVLDPTAAIPVFLAMTAGLSRRRSLLVAAYAVGVAFVVLLFFIVAGPVLLEALEFPKGSFQVAGRSGRPAFRLHCVRG